VITHPSPLLPSPLFFFFFFCFLHSPHDAQTFSFPQRWYYGIKHPYANKAAPRNNFPNSPPNTKRHPIRPYPQHLHPTPYLPTRNSMPSPTASCSNSSNSTAAGKIPEIKTFHWVKVSTLPLFPFPHPPLLLPTIPT
jgi:hypothetical protein